MAALGHVPCRSDLLVAIKYGATLFVLQPAPSSMDSPKRPRPSDVGRAALCERTFSVVFLAVLIV
jgi:hypothetical protein